MKLNLTQKLRLMGGIITVVVLLLIVLSFRSLRVHTRLSGMAEDVNAISNLMLENRRREKDFFLRKDVKYQENVQDQTRKILNKIRVLQGSHISGTADEILGLLETEVTEYARRFDAVVDLHLQRGLTEDLGLRGELREAVHNLEELLVARQEYELTIAMLQLRRREKDYLLRGDPEYIEELKEEHAKLVRHLDASSIDGATKTKMKELGTIYVAAIDGIVRIDGEIQTETDVFRDIAHRIMDPQLADLLREIHAAKERQESANAKVILVTSLVALGLTGVLIYLTTISTTATIGRLQGLVRRGAEGELSDRYTISETSLTQAEDTELPGLAAGLNQLLATLDVFIGKIESLCQGNLQSEIFDSPLPERFEELVRTLRGRLQELEFQAAVHGRTGAEGVVRVHGRTLEDVMIDNSAAILTGLALQARQVAAMLATEESEVSEIRGEKLRKALATLQVLSQGFHDQSQLVSHLLEPEEE